MFNSLLAARSRLWALCVGLCPLAACADDGAVSAGDTAWILTSTALVLFMTLPGLAAFYGGLVRTKNVLSVFMQCVTITAIVSVLWIFYGYGLAFGHGGSWQSVIGSLDKSFLAGIGRQSVVGHLPESVYAMFQLTFAIITPALIIGGFAERMRFSAVVAFTIAWFTLVYLPVVHWVWGGGWLMQLGVLDYAGGIVVHVTAGSAALVTALVVGPRRGFPHTTMAPHSLPLTVLGAGMLWVGWYGFNAGSALAADGNAGMALLVTHTGAAAGALTWTTIEWLKYGKPSMLGAVTGMVAGLGTITPASGFVGPVGGLVIGGVAGVVCFYATQLVKRKLHIDDSLDVSPVHGVGGVIGSILTGVFVDAALGGAGLANGVTRLHQIGVQTLAVAATAAWCMLVTYLILKVLARTTGLRVDAEGETEGLDLAEHGERAYSN